MPSVAICVGSQVRIYHNHSPLKEAGFLGFLVNAQSVEAETLFQEQVISRTHSRSLLLGSSLLVIGLIFTIPYILFKAATGAYAADRYWYVNCRNVWNE